MPAHRASTWQKKAPSVLLALPGIFCGLRSRHSNFVLWKVSQFAIRQPQYSRIHEEGHTVFPGIIITVPLVEAQHTAHGTLWSVTAERGPLSCVLYSVPYIPVRPSCLPFVQLKQFGLSGKQRQLAPPPLWRNQLPATLPAQMSCVPEVVGHVVLPHLVYTTPPAVGPGGPAGPVSPFCPINPKENDSRLHQIYGIFNMMLLCLS